MNTNLGTVPFSELAMHTKTAGKRIERYELMGELSASVWVFDDTVPVTGLRCEVLSWNIRNTLETASCDQMS